MMKKKILDALLDSGDTYLSGEQISQLFGVSRTAIWKHIKQLRSEGYEIESVTNKGYRLISMPTNYNGISIERALKQNQTMTRFIKEVLYFDSVDSTNQVAKQCGQTETFENTLIVADEQTAGKGRLGRRWESEKGKGIWMSLLLRPNISPENASYFTLIAATAMSRAIEEVVGLQTEIKWPNDIILDGKKVCGILTEMSAELNLIHYLVVGIGVNVSQTDFTGELTNKAVALKTFGSEEKLQRLNIIQIFVEYFEMYYNHFVEAGSLQNVIEYNRKHSATLNKKVVLIKREEKREVYAKDLDAFGRLIIINENNEEEVISSGEVSVRGLNGYL